MTCAVPLYDLCDFPRFYDHSDIVGNMMHEAAVTAMKMMSTTTIAAVAIMNVILRRLFRLR